METPIYDTLRRELGEPLLEEGRRGEEPSDASGDDVTHGGGDDPPRPDGAADPPDDTS